MSFKHVIALVLIILAAFQAQSATKIKGQTRTTSECKAIIKQVQGMHEAQRVLLNNMVKNNDTMATTLDEYAKELRNQSSHRRPVSTQQVKSLKQSAKAFRDHKAREQKLVSRFDEASGSVLLKVQSCLQQ